MWRALSTFVLALAGASATVAAGAPDATNRDVGWAVGAGGTIVATADGGKTWAAQESGLEVALRSVWFIDRQTGFAVGDKGAIASTTDGGKTWRAGKHPVGVRHGAVQFVGPSRGFITTFLGVLTTTDGGTTWNPIEVAGENLLRGASFVDASTGLVVGVDGEQNAPRAMRTTDGGKTWREVAIEKPPGVQLLDVAHGSRQAAWAVGQNLGEPDRPNGTILATRDGGKSWEVQWQHSVTYLYTTSFVSAETGWAAGYAGSLAKPLVLTTQDGGQNWKPRAVPGDQIVTGSQLVDEAHGWVVGTEGLIAATSDLGKTWARQDSGVARHLFAVHFPQPADEAGE